MERQQEQVGGSAFPAAIQAAWGLRPRPHKGPKRGLTLAGIVDAAVRVADTDGIDAVSMSRVAKEIGVSTMALYRYVDTKNELLTLMVDAAIGPPPELDDELGWRRGLEQWAAAVRDALLARPWTVQLVTAYGPPATPNQLAWLDQSLRMLRGTGLSEPEKVATSLLISGLVRSQVSVEVALREEPGSDRRWAEYEPFLRRRPAPRPPRGPRSRRLRRRFRRRRIRRRNRRLRLRPPTRPRRHRVPPPPPRLTRARGARRPHLTVPRRPRSPRLP